MLRLTNLPKYRNSIGITMTKREYSIGSAVNEMCEYLSTNNFDVFGFNSTDAYNSRIKGFSQPMQCLPADCIVLCVGNSRKLWPAAKNLLEKGHKNPFDSILTPTIANGCADIALRNNINCNVHYSHTADPFLVAFQHLALETGIGVFMDELQLVLHPVYGPWFGLRFAIVLHSSWKSASELHSLRPLCNLTVPVADIECCRSLLVGKPYSPELHIKARKCISVGQEHAYDDDQLMYHYHIKL